MNGRGDLSVSIEGGEVIERAPIVYQEVDGSRRVLSGRYVKLGARGIGFEIADYDRRLPLVIDPVLVYSTYLGGSGQDISNSIAVDDSGNAYVTGYTTSANFPTTTGAYQGAFGGGFYDAFVGKLNATGTALVYSTYWGVAAWIRELASLLIHRAMRMLQASPNPATSQPRPALFRPPWQVRPTVSSLS